MISYRSNIWVMFNCIVLKFDLKWSLKMVSIYFYNQDPGNLLRDAVTRIIESSEMTNRLYSQWSLMSLYYFLSRCFYTQRSTITTRWIAHEMSVDARRCTISCNSTYLYKDSAKNCQANLCAMICCYFKRYSFRKRVNHWLDFKGPSN